MAQQVRLQIQRALRDQPLRPIEECEASRHAAHSPGHEGQSDQRLRLRGPVARRPRRLPGSFELRLGAFAEPALLECPGLAKTGMGRKPVRRGGFTQAPIQRLRVRIVVGESGERGQTEHGSPVRGVAREPRLPERSQSRRVVVLTARVASRTGPGVIRAAGGVEVTAGICAIAKVQSSGSMRDPSCPCVWKKSSPTGGVHVRLLRPGARCP